MAISDALPPESYIQVCGECGTVAPEGIPACPECGEQGHRTQVWTGPTEYPHQQEAVEREIAHLQQRARLFPESRVAPLRQQLAKALEFELQTKTHYEVLEIDPTASAREVRMRALSVDPRSDSGIPRVMATTLWEEARAARTPGWEEAKDAGYSFDAPTAEEREIFKRRWREAVAVLGDPALRAAYDRDIGIDQEELVGRLLGSTKTTMYGETRLPYGEVWALMSGSLAFLFFVLWGESHSGFRPLLLAGLMTVVAFQMSWANRFAAILIARTRTNGRDDTNIRRALYVPIGVVAAAVMATARQWM